MPELNINMNPHETPEGDNHEEVTSAEVPAYHYRSVLDDDDDEDVDNEIIHDSDDDDNRYELLSQEQEGEDASNGHVTYYQHTMMVNWVDMDENGHPIANGHDDMSHNQSENDIANDSQDSSHTSTDDVKQDEKESGNDVESLKVIMNEEHIEKIKSAMKGFELPKDNIPQWASVVGDEKLKELLQNKIEEKKRSGSENESLDD